MVSEAHRSPAPSRKYGAIIRSVTRQTVRTPVEPIFKDHQGGEDVNLFNRKWAAGFESGRENSERLCLAFKPVAAGVLGPIQRLIRSF